MQLEEGSNFCKACGENVSGIEAKKPASIGLRFADLILDAIGRFIFGILIGMAFLALHMQSAVLAWLVGFFGYYALFEGVWQRSPAKFITGTKVVMLDGSKPSLGRVLLRALCMLIPFDPFSYIGNHTPEGWHDRLSHVIVVPKHYTAEDVKAIDHAAIRKNTSMVGIIIAIVLGCMVVIGILASVVLTSLQNARQKALEAKQATPQSSIPQ